MGLVNKAVTNLIGGVSEQSPSVRSDNQVSEQINMFSELTTGLSKRSGTELVNVVPLDIKDRFNLTFNVDNVKHMVAINALDNLDPIKYVPLTANSQVLSAAIVNKEYFIGGLNNSLQVVEDKDNVYILNRDKEVGVLTSFSANYDLTVVEDSTGNSTNKWTSGSYDLNIISDPEVGSPHVSTVNMTYTVDKNTQLSEIMTFFNTDSAFSNEIGELVITGNRSNMRISVIDITGGWAKPVISATEVVPIVYTGIISSSWEDLEPYTGIFGTPFNIVAISPTLNRWVTPTGISNWVPISSVYNVGGILYRRYVREPDSYLYVGDKIYRIQEHVNVFGDMGHSVSVQTSAPVTVFEGARSKRAIAWVTGVSSEQTYTLKVNYKLDIAPYTEASITGSSSVGTTPANIRLNFVAGQLASTLNVSGFSTEQYSNAVLINAPSGYSITSVEAENNYDITSISGVTEANIKNTEGLPNIDNLPPLFIDGFKVRVSAKDSDKTNYYMVYDASFKGWKEGSISSLRLLDKTTMPYIISKEKVRQTGIITVEPAAWQKSEAGDLESNKDPTFVNRKITSIFFYGSRLGLSTEDTLVMSKINAPDTFYKTTTATISKSDRVDIKLDSSKIGFDPISSVSQYNSGLIINTNTKQSKLLVNNAFELGSARLSEVSSYSLGTNLPISSENSLYFTSSNSGLTSVVSYKQLAETQYTAVILTNHCPNYIKGNVTQLIYSSGLTCIRTDFNKKEVYIQNSLSKGIETIQNAWHKWVLPYDVEFTYFFDNRLYFVMSMIDSDLVAKTVITRFDYKSPVVTNKALDGDIGWKPLLDCYTEDSSLVDKFVGMLGVHKRSGYEYQTFNDAYNNTQITNETFGPITQDNSANSFYWYIDGSSIKFKVGVTTYEFGNPEDSTQVYRVDFPNSPSLIFNKLDSLKTGYTDKFEMTFQEIIPAATLVNNSVIFGIPYTSKVVLSPAVPKEQTKDGSSVALSYAKLMLRRMRVSLSKSGKFIVKVNLLDRLGYEASFTGKPLGSLVLGESTIDDIVFNFPINAKADRVEISIESANTTPLNIISTEWQGQLIRKGNNI